MLYLSFLSNNIFFQFSLMPPLSVPMTLTASKSITVHEGEPLELVCEADGIPKPTVVLHKVVEYKGLNDQGDSTSYISNAGREHAGTYLCIATQYVVDSSQLIPKPNVQLSTFSVTVLGKCILHRQVICYVCLHSDPSFLAFYCILCMYMEVSLM